LAPLTTTKTDDRLLWCAILHPTDPVLVYGAIRLSPRLHRAQDAAMDEAQSWVTEPIKWEVLDDPVLLGRVSNRLVVIRSIMLPLGED